MCDQAAGTFDSNKKSYICKNTNVHVAACTFHTKISMNSIDVIHGVAKSCSLVSKEEYYTDVKNAYVVYALANEFSSWSMSSIEKKELCCGYKDKGWIHLSHVCMN